MTMKRYHGMELVAAAGAGMALSSMWPDPAWVGLGTLTCVSYWIWRFAAWRRARGHGPEIL